MENSSHYFSDGDTPCTCIVIGPFSDKDAHLIVYALDCHHRNEWYANTGHLIQDSRDTYAKDRSPEINS